jgi:tetratricopeptide (TPR) repeat protein
MLAAALSTNGLYDLSIKWSKKAYFKYPKDPRMGYNYSLSLFKTGHQEDACAVLEQLLQSFPGYALPYIELVSHYITNGDNDSLYRVLLQMETVYQQYPEAFTSKLPQEKIDACFNILSDLKSPKEQE